MSPAVLPPASDASLQVWGICGLPLVRPGDDLAGLLADALATVVEPRAGDVLVVAQKVVSKAEARQVRLDTVNPGEAARALSQTTGKAAGLCQLVLDDAREVMRAVRDLVVVRHRLGHVLANAGIDASNVADPAASETVLLWPKDPDASATRLREALQTRLSIELAVIVSDSLGRAWRMGTTGHAIGVAGLDPLRDRRGEVDLFGRPLRATVIGVADEIAAAASLVMGEGAEAIPAALVRGATYTRVQGAGVKPMLRPLEQDLFQ